MNYDLLIIKIQNPHSKQVLARKIAADPAISMHKALSLLENLPLVYMKDLSAKELEDASEYLAKLGVVCRAIESKDPFISPGTIAPPKQPELAVAEKIKPPKIHIMPPPVSLSIKPHSDDAQSAMVSQPKKKSVWRNSPGARMVFFVIIGLTILIVILQGRNRYFGIDLSSVQKPKTPLTDSSADTLAQPKYELKHSDMVEKNVESEYEESYSIQSGVTPDQSKRSGEYTDSAIDADDDYIRAIKFYKTAILLNQNNVSAWQGLLVAYTGAHMTRQAQETIARMEELFGNTLCLVGASVGPYGIVTSFNRDSRGVCRFEYRSRMITHRELEMETFNITRALLEKMQCSQLSIYASTTRGSGMLVRLLDTPSSPRTLSEYRRAAMLSYVE